MKTSWTALAAAATVVLAALDPIEVRGNAFYKKGGNERFYIRGIDYQPGGSSKVVDPLADEDNCKRDVPVFKDLGVNMIRVYSVDNSANHDACMKMLDDAGIYLLLDVNTPDNSLNRADENSLKLSYNSDYLQSVFATIDAFKDYDNTFGFFSANEVINSDNTTIAAPYIKAVGRDMKAYIKAQSKRTIPVGYSAADISDSRWQQMTYLNCGDDSERIDMFGMNDYSWCGDKSSFSVSGWENNVKSYSNYSIPMFLSEYGCNTNLPRTFPEVAALYSDKMSAVYSGGLVYEYSQEANKYGLVQLSSDSVKQLDDYSYFKKALANANDPSGDGGASTSRAKADCPPIKKGTWEVDPDSPLPQMPKYAQRYLKDGAGKGLGFGGTPTQYGSTKDDPNNANQSSDSDSSSAAAASGSGSSSGSSSQASASASGSGSSSSSKNAANLVASLSLAPLVGAVLGYIL